MRCPSCGSYSFDIAGRCKYCGVTPPTSKPRFELGKVDVFKLAQLLKEKREKREANSETPTTSE